MDQRPWEIYALLDPRTEAVRYVGWSFDSKRRLKGHLRDKSKTHKACWIRSLLALGLEPKMTILETGTGNWASQERWWIAKSRFYGADLTNATDGGDGVSGMIWSDEAKQRASIAHIGKPGYWTGKHRTEEMKQKDRDASTGRYHLEEAKDKISKSLTGHAVSQITKDKIRVSLEGRSLPEKTKVKMREARYVYLARLKQSKMEEAICRGAG